MKKLAVVLMVFGLASSVLASELQVETGLVVRMDMSSVVTDGLGNVTGWNDLTSNNNDAVQTVSASQPVLVSSITPTGSSAVKFDGTNDYLSMTPNLTFDGGSWTMFAVYAVDAFSGSSGGMRVISFGHDDIDPTGTVKACNTTYCMMVGGTTGGVRSGSRTAAAGSVFVNSGIPTGYATDTFYVAGITMDSVTTNAVAYLTTANGTISTGSGTGSTSVGSGNNLATIGCGTTGLTNPAPGNFLNGWVSEILVYNRVLSSSEITSVNEYLRVKYVPEPATISLLAMGIMGLFVRRGK